jgi:anti-sigma factor ChrR (cupin superfamily)
MSAERKARRCERAEDVSTYALGAMPEGDVAAIEAHVASCAQCARELDEMRSVVDALADWPNDVLRPPASLQARLARRIAVENGGEDVMPASREWPEPPWEQVAPGISCKLLATDAENHRVSMLVRLAPGAHYPPHRHAGVEELHLLDGELWIEDRKLYPGDYNRAEPGTGDTRVWSETGCTCVLITSTRDTLT